MGFSDGNWTHHSSTKNPHKQANPTEVHTTIKLGIDAHATILRRLGFDHECPTFRFQGRDYRLADIHGQVEKGVLM